MLLDTEQRGTKMTKRRQRIKNTILSYKQNNITPSRGKDNITLVTRHYWLSWNTKYQL